MKKNYRIFMIKIKKLLMVLLIALAFMDVSIDASASHLVGGQITYTWLTGTTYRIRYTLYRDCSGIGAPTSVILTTAPATSNINLSRISFSDVSLLCPGQVSRCNGGTTAGIEEHIYEGNATFSPATIYTLSVSQNARTAIITTLLNPGSQSMYLTAILNTNFAGNSSPQFLNKPIAQFCTNQPASISPNGADANGDVILYSLTNALRAAGTPVTYAAGFSGLNPLSSSSGISINPNTGQLSFTPSAVQVAVVSIKAEEFRGGIKIGEVNRDVMITMLNCGANTPPVIAALPNVIVPVGNTYCVNVNATDNVAQSISLTAVSSIIPPATFTITSAGAGFTNGTFCFSPTAANTGNTYTVTINAQDNFCPTPGTASRSFNITVPAPCNVSVNSSSTPADCGVSNGTATASLVGGTAPYVYSWTGPSGFTAITQSISGLAPGTYCVNITDAFNCASTDCVVVQGGTAFPISATVVNTVCGFDNGSITVSATGGVEPYSYQINGGVVQSSNLFSNLGIGAYNITVTDFAGCTTSEIFNVAAESDVTPPTAICKSATVVLNGLGAGMLTVAMVNDGSTDNCSIASYSLSKTSFDCNDVGTQNVTLTVTDASNNSSTCVATVTVVDDTPPFYVDCSNITIALDANGMATLTAEQIVDVAEIYEHEACGIASIVLSQTNFTCSNLGANTVTVIVTDIHGNVSSCTSTVTVVDNIAPAITCNAPIVVSNDAGQCGAVVTYTVTSTDNCAGQTIAQTAGLSSGSVFPVGVTTNTFVVTDASGNTATCSFTVTVNDTENPTIACNAPISVNNDLGVCGAAVSYSVTSSDNCPNQVVTQTVGLASGSVFPVGVTTNTFVVRDASGNTATCSFTVTVTDNEKPVISVQDIARCFADDNFGCSIDLGVTATDNCAVQSLTSNAPNCFPVGTTTVTWTATDIYGNVNTATQLVTRNPEINIDICAGPTRTIYTGTTSGVGPFGPQTVNLSSTVTGGTPAYSYEWTPSTGLNNALIANPVASPTVTTVYTLTVTDSKGCKRSLSITINVLPLSAAVCSGSGNNVKFSVCHIPPGNPNNPNNICISVNALNAHLTSGSNGHNNCYLGPCQQNCFSTTPGATSLKATRQEADEMIVSEEPIVEVQQPDFSVNVFPNPTAHDFSIRVMSKSNEPITIRIMDINGKVRSVETVFSKANNIKVGSKLLSGSYIAEVIQGTNRQMIKLVKLN